MISSKFRNTVYLNHLELYLFYVFIYFFEDFEDHALQTFGGQVPPVPLWRAALTATPA